MCPEKTLLGHIGAKAIITIHPLLMSLMKERAEFPLLALYSENKWSILISESFGECL